MMQDQLVEGQVAMISNLYSNATLYTPMPPDNSQPPGGEQPTKRRRRRKSRNNDGSNNTGMRKRKLSEEQVNMLEMNFGCEHKLESERKDKLALELGLDPRQVAVWFQNRRARWKNKKLEDEYSKLKNDHDNLVVDKCHLETEVLGLKDQLNEAKKEIKKLMERSSSSSIIDNGSTNSPSSSLTMEHQANVIDPQFLGENQFVGLDGCFDNMFYGPNTADYATAMDCWANLYNM